MKKAKVNSVVYEKMVRDLNRYQQGKEGSHLPDGRVFRPRDFLKSAQDSNVFVIDPQLWHSLLKSEDLDASWCEKTVCEETIPFKSIWVELADEAPLMRYPNPMEREKWIVTKGFHLVEIEPGKVSGVYYDQDKEYNYFMPADKVSTRAFCNVLHKAIRKGRCGAEKADQIIYIPHPLGVGVRKVRTLSTVVRIVPKAAYSTTKTLFNKSIDWSHSWEVRGHWMKCSGLGKNRAGERVVQGLTWRIPHVKGQGVLIKKIRKVANAK